MSNLDTDIPLPPQLRVFEALRSYVRTGGIPPGTPLPSERVLSEKFGVGRSVIRTALGQLRRDGFIDEDKEGKRFSAVKSGALGIFDKAEFLGGTIAVLTPTPRLDPTHGQPGWMDHLSQGAILEARRAGRDVLAIHPDRMLDGGIDRVLEARPYGLVISEWVGPVPTSGNPLQARRSLLELMAQSGVHAVAYGSSEELVSIDRVLSDHACGCADIVRWLAGQGCRRILRLWPTMDELYWVKARSEGYELATSELGIETLGIEWYSQIGVGLEVSLSKVFDARVHQLMGHLVAHLLSPNPVDAIVLINDGDVAIASAACRKLGREPGRDVLIAGYDNFWAESPERPFEPAPPAVTVDKHNAVMGSEMVRMLIDRIEGRLPEGPQSRKMPPELVVPSAS